MEIFRDEKALIAAPVVLFIPLPDAALLVMLILSRDMDWTLPLELAAAARSPVSVIRKVELESNELKVYEEVDDVLTTVSVALERLGVKSEAAKKILRQHEVLSFSMKSDKLDNTLVV